MERLTASEWTSLIHGVFAPDPARDRGLAFLLDVPDDKVPDNPEWQARRRIVVDWAAELRAARVSHGWDVVVVAVPNVGMNNADLPEGGFLWAGAEPPDHIRDLGEAESIPIQEAFGRWSMWIAPTEFSATAPLKLASRDRRDFRAATMPRFSAAMIPALRLPYDEIHQRVTALKALLDPADGAEIDFVLDDGTTDRLYLDLRFRSAHASGALVRENGQAGNLPSGGSYIVPYEGEDRDHQSR